MNVMDQINQRFPNTTVIAVVGLDRTWKSRHVRCSKSYTTNWDELVEVE